VFYLSHHLDLESRKLQGHPVPLDLSEAMFRRNCAAHRDDYLECLVDRGIDPSERLFVFCNEVLVRMSVSGVAVRYRMRRVVAFHGNR